MLPGFYFDWMGLTPPGETRHKEFVKRSREPPGGMEWPGKKFFVFFKKVSCYIVCRI